ncbi:hypothetical protein D3C72_1647790 [compost metagenome]
MADVVAAGLDQLAKRRRRLLLPEQVAPQEGAARRQVFAQGGEDGGGLTQVLARRFGRADGHDQVEGRQGGQGRRRGLAAQADPVGQARRPDARFGAFGHDRVQFDRRHLGVEGAGQMDRHLAIGAADVHDGGVRFQARAARRRLQPIHRQGVADGQGVIGDVMKGDAHGQGLECVAASVSEKELYNIKFLAQCPINRQGETP